VAFACSNGLIFREFIMPNLRLQRLHRRLGFVQSPLGALTASGFRGQRGFDALQSAGGRARHSCTST
jgi:hypothetical protein